MAHAGRLQLDEYLARARRVELGWFNGQRLPLFPQDRGVNVHGLMSALAYTAAP
jgi:hypothetical protein